MKSCGWLLPAILLAACSGERDPGGAGGGGSGGGYGGSGGGGGAGGSGGSVSACADPPAIEDGAFTGWAPAVPALLDADDIPEASRPASCPETYDYVTTVRGWVVAPGGAPIPCALVQMCVYYWDGSKVGYVCLAPAETDAEGVYTKVLPEEQRCLRSAAARVILPDSGRATTYCPVGGAANGVLRVREPVMLPLVAAPKDLPPEGDPQSARWVEFEDGLRIEVTPSRYLSNAGTYEEIGAKRVPVDATGLCGDRAGFDGLYALYREGLVQDPGFPLAIPNTSGLPAGTRVELLVMGGLECQIANQPVPEAEWAPFGEGTVSEDGTTITSEDGSGLPCFTWLAYREIE